MTTQLNIYNGALLLCGERKLSALTETRSSRYDLDQVWNDGGVNACLAQGQWVFATRTQQLDYDTSITTSFGYTYAFAIPTDSVTLISVCSDQDFNVPLTEYAIETGYIYSYLQTIYIKFISNDASYGTDYANWPANFTEWVKAYFASKVVWKITSDENKKDMVKKEELRLRKLAKSTDAKQKPTRFPAQGSWNSSRQGSMSGDRGNKSSLTG